MTPQELATLIEATARGWDRRCLNDARLRMTRIQDWARELVAALEGTDGQ